MNKRNIVFAVLIMPLGAFLFVFGGADDSPGAQLLGVIVFVAGAWKARRATRSADCSL